MSRNSWFAILACALLLLGSLPAVAATQNAVVYGTVYDSAGNPMAGVTVTLENAAFGFSRTTTTASDGSYNFAEVPPADGYKVTATLSGRKVDVRGGIAVNVGDERVILPPLREQAAAPAPTPGAAPAAPAAAEGPAVHPETVSSAVSGVITRDQLLALPLYNRNFLALGLITPNVHDVQQGSALAGASFSVSGNRPEANDFLLDGADNVAASSNQAIPFQVNDSIQEFRVVSSTAPAEYGRGQGGVVNVVTRRATNNWHGSAFGYFGADALNADSPLSVYNGTTFDQAAAHAGSMTPTVLAPIFPGFPAAPTTYNNYVATAAAKGYCTNSIGVSTARACATGGTGANTLFDPATILKTHDSHTIPFSSQQFGFNIGGPLKKDKLFVFGSYEGTRIDNPNPVFERVPSTFDRTFDTLATRAAYPGYTFSSGLGATDPNFLMANKLLKLYPAANVIAVPDALEFFQGEAPNYTHVNNLLARADWVLSDRSSLSFRYVVQELNQLHDATLPPSANYPGNGSLRNALNHNLNVSFSHALSTTLLNELHAGFNRFSIQETAQDHKFVATTLGFPGAQLPTIFLSGLDAQYSGANPAAMGAYGNWWDQFFGPVATPSPNMPTLDGLFPFARLGAPLNSPSQTKDTTAFVGDTLSWSRGKHSFKFGGEYRNINDHYFDGSFSRGYLVSSDIGEFTSDSNMCIFSPGCLGSGFLAPSFDYAARQNAPYTTTFNHAGIAGFVQDTWRVNRRLTLNLGVRYEYFSIPTEDNNQIWNFDPNAHGLVQQNGRAVFDPLGNQCTGNPAFAYQNLNAPFFALIAGFPQNWNCTLTGSNKIASNNTTNFAPRMGLAWDIFGTGKTVFRGGVGWFYDQLPANNVSPLMYNRPTHSSLTNPQLILGQGFFNVGCFFNSGIIVNCGFGNTTVNPANFPFPLFNTSANSQAAVSPFGMLARDVSHSDTPHTRQATATIQQQLGNHMVLEAGYIGTQGTKLPVIFNANFNNEWFCTNTTTGPLAPCDTTTFYPVFTMTNRASSTYNSFMARVRAQKWHGLYVNATYVWSNSEDNASNGIFPVIPATFMNQVQAVLFSTVGNPALLCYGNFFGGTIPAGPGCPPLSGINVAGGQALTTTGQGAANVSRYLIPQDPNNFLQNDWGSSDFNVTHRFVVDYVWEVPGKGTWKGNWVISGVFIGQSGQPFTAFSGPVFGEINQRVNVAGSVTQNNSNPNAAIGTTGLQLPGAACSLTGPANLPLITGAVPFQGPPAGLPCLGNSARNQFTGPKYINWNMAVQKGFQVFGEGRMLTLRAEFYNLTDRANYFNPISQFSLDGINVNPDFGKIKSAKDPREIQFGVRFSF